MYSVLSETNDWNKACTTLSRRQLELYMTLPTDLKRVAPVLVVSALPMAQNVVFPLALMFPKQLLSSHFWTPEVRKQIVAEQQLARHQFYRRLLRDLIRASKQQDNLKMKGLLKTLTAEREHPSPEQILQVVGEFSEKERGFLRLSALNSLHVKHLMSAHGLDDWFWWRYKLTQYANLLHHIDLAILREGGVGYMGDADLRYVCLWRGLNATEDVSRAEMLDYVGRWMAVSEKLSTDCPSLLLHLPLLLGYNHRSRHWDDQTVI